MNEDLLIKLFNSNRIREQIAIYLSLKSVAKDDWKLMARNYPQVLEPMAHYLIQNFYLNKSVYMGGQGAQQVSISIYQIRGLYSVKVEGEKDRLFGSKKDALEFAELVGRQKS